MKVPSIIQTAGAILLSSSSITPSSAAEFTPYGFQSGSFPSSSSSNNPSQSELLNDDTYAASMYYDPLHSLLFVTGSTYGTYFDSATNLSSEIKGAMGMSDKEGGRDGTNPHLEYGDCFLGILKLPIVDGPMKMKDGDNPNWLIHVEEETGSTAAGPELIYARRFGTAHNSESCSSVLMLPKVNDALLQTAAQLKLVLLGHANPYPEEGGGGERQLRGQLEGSSSKSSSSSSEQQQQHLLDEKRQLQSNDTINGNRGALLHSLSGSNQPKQKGSAYGFILDFDLSLTLDETFTTTLPDDNSFQNAYGALLGGYVLESSPLVYPTAMTQNKRDPNQVYVVSMHSDDDTAVGKLNPEYAPDEALEEFDGTLKERTDMTLGGAGGSGSHLVGGVPKYGTDFYVKVQQLTVTPYEQLMDVEPTPVEKVKKTMESGWGFGFKLNDANDVRPSCVVFVKGRTPNEDLLLLGGTTRKDGVDGKRGELDGFITKLIPPAPTPIADQTTGNSPEDAMEDEMVHPTKRIDSTTGRDETVTAICLPPPDPVDGITHAYVVGSTTTSTDHGGTMANGGHDPSLGYILKLRLDDLSTVWKEHVSSIHVEGVGGDVLGEGCAVSPDGKMVYLSGTIDGKSALDTGIGKNTDIDIQPVGGKSDVFVVAFDVTFGNVQWARQLGTMFADKLARGGGVVCDNEGNVILMGSTRGGMQRYREVVENDGIRDASDVFVMSLSRVDGGYVNAPYTGGEPVSSSGGTLGSSISSPATASATDSNTQKGGGRLSGGAIAIISLLAIVLSGALLYFVYSNRRRWPKIMSKKRRRKKKQYDYSGRDGDVLRTWNNGGDDFSYDNRSLGGRKDNSTNYDRSPGGSLRIVRGRGSDEDNWDEYSTGSNSSKGSYKSKSEDSNSDFLASLRREANATMKKMVREEEDISADHDHSTTEDPRLDGGASIKSLLTHYREVKKGTLFENDDDDNSGSGGSGSGSGGSSAGKNKEEGGNNNSVKSKQSSGKTRRKPPPPPPRRKKKDDQEVVEAALAEVNSSTIPDGLSEFTIV